MKTFLFLLNLTGLLTLSAAHAQTEAYYVDPRTWEIGDTGKKAAGPGEARPGEARFHEPKGYWRLHTEAGSRSTLVRFYAPDHRLIYEESMPDQYVRLTDRNVARLDDIRDRLVNGHLVASTLKAEPMTATPTESMVTSRAEAAWLAAVPTETNKKGYPILANSYLQTSRDRLLLSIANPERHRLTIIVRNERNTTDVYHEFINARDYSRKLNLAELPSGQYRLIVQTANRHFRYTRLIELKP